MTSSIARQIDFTSQLFRSLFTSFRTNISELIKMSLFSVLSLLCVLFFSGCGGSSSATPPPPEIFAKKLASLSSSNTKVFFSVEIANDRFELFSVDPITGVSSGISDTFSANNGLKPFSVSSNGLKVAYRADKDNDGFDELYSNLDSGGLEVKLVDRLETNLNNSNQLDHINWQWTADNNRIIFRSDPDKDSIYQIQSILSDGTDLQQLSGNLPAKCDSSKCWIMASDSSFVTFKTEILNQSSQFSQNLFSVSPDGSGLVQISQILIEDSRINDWNFSPDNSRIAYVSQNAGQPADLFTVFPDGSARIKVNTDSLSVGVDSFDWSPDSALIAYTHDVLAAGVANLFTNLSDGSNRTALVDNFFVANPNVSQWEWSPDSEHIAYIADQNTLGKAELYTVKNDGQWHRRLNDPLPDGGKIQQQWQWSPDSQYIAFYAEIDPSEDYDELYSASFDARQLTKVNYLHPLKLQIVDKHWTEDSIHIIYATVDSNDKIIAIYSVLPDGSNIVQLTNVLENGQSINENYQLSPDSQFLLYQIDSQDRQSASLHLCQIASSNRLTLSSLGKINQFIWLADSTRVVFSVKEPDKIHQTLYSILTDGTGKKLLY